jgi:hypothetical protein
LAFGKILATRDLKAWQQLAPPIAYADDSLYVGTYDATIARVDVFPTAVADSATLAEDSRATAIDVLANDTDLDGGPKRIVSTEDGGHGTVTITNSGAGLTYRPAADYNGPDSFPYTLNGGSTARVSITVTAVDDLPVAGDDSKTPAEDSGSTAIETVAVTAVAEATPAPPDTQHASPDNSFSFVKLKRNLNKGTAKLRVNVPGAGKLRLKKTKRVRRDADQVPAGSKVWLKVRPRPKAKQRLAEAGNAKGRARVIYTPTGGEPITESRKVKLKLR